jgi:hypothetical protein
VATIIQEKHRDNQGYKQRWTRLERHDLFEPYDALHAQEVSQRQAAQMLDMPRSTLQAWRMYQDRLHACPTVVAFFHSHGGDILSRYVIERDIPAIGTAEREAWRDAAHHSNAVLAAMQAEQKHIQWEHS